MTLASHFLSCDWGTSHFRLRLIDRIRMAILDEYTSDDGIQALALNHPQSDKRRSAMAEVLRRSIDALALTNQPHIPVMMSGMASSTLGWQSLPYTPLPAPLDGSTLRYLDFEIDEHPVRLISGLHSTNDVMRGEETELVGLFAGPAKARASDDFIVILPGTHSKHVQICNGTITDFTTYMTGELFQVLSTQSTLRVAGETLFDETAFRQGLEASQNPGLSRALFRTRSLTLLGQLTPAHSPAYLSGMLIGTEFSTLTGTPPSRILLAAGDQLAEQYHLAISTLLPATHLGIIDPDELGAAAIRGHAALLPSA